MKPPPPRRSRRGWWVIASLALAGALALGWRVLERHRLAAGGIPPQPALEAGSAALGERLARAEATARGLLHPAAGLAALSRLYHANGFFNEALQCYEGLQRLEPREARWPHLRASLLAGFGQLEAALPLWQTATALAPAYVPARLKLGEALLKTNRTAAAASAYTEVLARDAGNPHALLGLARCALAGGDWTKARENLQRAIGLHPDFVGARSLMVTLHEHFGEQPEADALRLALGKSQAVDVSDPWLDELSDDSYDPYRLSVAASIAELAGDMAAARRWLERAIALAPGNNSYPRELGKLFFKAHDNAAARRQFEQAVKLAPGDADAWALLVELLTTLGERENADRALAAGLASCPQSPALHRVRGERLSETGRLAGAEAEFKTAIALRPNEAEAYLGLALIYFRLDRTDEGLAEMKRALAAQPDHPLAMEVLARQSIATSDEPAARDWLRRLRQQPRVPAADLKTIADEYRQRFGRAPW